ncbi:hypothetical protein EVAR_30472_1 [Eumeta japonica]|uniref:Uncharacterized protein n=1 Tax=Eumeta variegata TaxID=151549 RepID=A0A4C1W0C6_EUMVA|nr:hypothetical protein EVAR_30472_1 [Eumeta japonica]
MLNPKNYILYCHAHLGRDFSRAEVISASLFSGAAFSFAGAHIKKAAARTRGGPRRALRCLQRKDFASGQISEFNPGRAALRDASPSITSWRYDVACTLFK